MFLCLDFSFATRAANGEVREESLSVLPNRSVAGSHAGETGAERVGEAYRGESCSHIAIDELAPNQNCISSETLKAFL